MVFFALLCVLKVNVQQKRPPWGVAVKESVILRMEAAKRGEALFNMDLEVRLHTHSLKISSNKP